MSHQLDHARARFASQRVLGGDGYNAFGDVNTEGDEVTLGSRLKVKLKDYVSVVNGAVPFLRQCGLLQLAAFYASKKDQHHAVLADIAAWLKQCELTRRLCTSLSLSPATETAKALTAMSSETLPILEAETEAILVWLKRLAEAKSKELERSEASKREGRKEPSAPGVPTPPGASAGPKAGGVEAPAQ